MTRISVEIERSDQEQVESLRKWWQDNWLSLVGGLAIGLGGIMGWQYYGQHQAERAAVASMAYDSLRQQIDNGELPAARATLEELQQDQSGSPYVTQGRLAVAQALAAQGEWSGAAGELEKILVESDDDQLKALARLRLARAYWAQGDAERALEQIAGEAPPAFAPLYAELRGDIATARGNLSLARSAYSSALASEQNYVDRGAVERKLGALPAESP